MPKSTVKGKIKKKKKKLKPDRQTYERQKRKKSKKHENFIEQILKEKTLKKGTK
jgi:hypothetical protein